MFFVKSLPWFILFYLPISVVFTQTNNAYTGYRTKFQYVASCLPNQYYDIALLQCSDCPPNTTRRNDDRTQCDCNSTDFYYGVNQGGGSLICAQCPSGYKRSIDGFGCTVPDPTCNNTNSSVFPSESLISGSLYSGGASAQQPRTGNSTCTQCVDGTLTNQISQRCAPCANVTPQIGTPPGTIQCCPTGDTRIKDGICLTNIFNALGFSVSSTYLNSYSSPKVSSFFQQRLDASVYLCRMNLNSTTASSPNRTHLSNVTACQVLANIAAMQFYNPTTNYAFDLYKTYIWESTSPQIWTNPLSFRPAIPFLAYPSTYYQEVNNASYDWIPSTMNQDSSIGLKLAKYSALGKYINTFDANDSVIQLCGRRSTDGLPAFTFGTKYKKSCLIRADALWNSSLYDTEFFDPYIVFTQNNSYYMLPTPVVIKNYQTETGTYPNKDSDESKWVYHRRFFLIDRISGVTNGDLQSVHYAKSIKVLNTMSDGGQYIQPPVIVVEYGELTSTTYGTGMLIEITFETDYRMNLDSHIRSIWISIGVLSGLGIVLAIIKTMIWYSRAGKQIVDLQTIIKFVLFLVNIIGTVFFIVMAGVSLWWLIFFKRLGSVYLVIPSAIQQASFTALVCVAFGLKTIDILHLIISQTNVDVFFIDWEKPKPKDQNAISVWRSYFVANEFDELQTYRRFSPTFQLMTVLLLLKVINLENIATAQPSTTLFPTSAVYNADYNGMLRIGIAFSIWLAIALIQYLFYAIVYQRFVEDKVINFIDLCSLSNISIFILMDKQYGFYIHARSPNEATDVNIQRMMLNFKGESEGKVSKRGLDFGTDDQLFIIKIDRKFRIEYDNLLRIYRQRSTLPINKKGEENESALLLKSYRNMNNFLCGFLNRSPTNHTYSIYPRRLLEKLFNFEFRSTKKPDSSGQTESIFFVDRDRNFTATMFCGHENSLLIWNMAVFFFVDYFTFNYVLAAIITYIGDKLASRIRSSLGGSNLSKKTLIPKNFLI